MSTVLCNHCWAMWSCGDCGCAYNAGHSLKLLLHMWPNQDLCNSLSCTIPPPTSPISPQAITPWSCDVKPLMCFAVKPNQLAVMLSLHAPHSWWFAPRTQQSMKTMKTFHAFSLLDTFPLSSSPLPLLSSPCLSIEPVKVFLFFGILQ